MSVREDLARLIKGVAVGQRATVAFDGPDAAGKTTLAREVAGCLRRPVVVASIDGWHNPCKVRTQRGELSPEGYYLDSFDLDALVSECLAPFRSGAPTIRTARFDYRSEEEVSETCRVAPDAVLLFDGVFLQRPELLSLWDIRVYVDVPESVTLARALTRDVRLAGSAEEVRRRYTQRYLPGQALYREAASPREHAHIVIDNTHPGSPRAVRWSKEMML